MKNFLTSTKGKIIAGAATLVVIAAAVITVILLNRGYRNIRVVDLSGTTKVSSGASVSEAFEGRNLKNGDKVSVGEKSDLTLALDSDKHVIATELTKFRLEAVGVSGKDSRTVIRLETGCITNEIDNKLLPSESYVVESPNATMSVRGTIFTVEVFFDSEGLCHTVVEVSEGVVELEEKGTGNNQVKTLNTGEKSEVVSRVEQENNEIPSTNGGDTPNNMLPGQPVNRNYTYNNPEILAVEQAIETFLNDGALDTTNFDRITSLKIYGNVVFAKFDDESVCGKGAEPRAIYSLPRIEGSDDEGSLVITYRKETGETQDNSNFNSLTSLDFLSEMKGLKSLSIIGGKITDISAISELSELTELNLDRNKISDISAISSLTKLSVFRASYNQISDISALVNLKTLTVLGLGNNRISDISILSNLTMLTSLNLGENQISDISTLSNLKELTYLNIAANQISDISILSNLTMLTSLSISDNRISNISIVSNLTELTELFMDNNNISDISYVSSLTKLTYLYFANNNISDISPISGLKSLQFLHISNNPFSDYSPLYGLTNLISITLSGASEEVIQEIKQSSPDVSIWISNPTM